MTDETTTQPSGPGVKARNVTAVLGPTNTGKTHLAIERMLGHNTGLIGLPLRLLAREVYDRIIKKVNPSDVALITGEERIKPASPRYYVCTVEAMPRDVEVDFVAIDEVQLAADPERGHVFTDRLLHMRGEQETLLLGSATMRQAITDLLPGCNFITRPRLSKLTYAGQKKLTRLPRRAAVVAFSAAEVYEVAELLRRQRGGAAVVLGALSPRTRNAQVALYQNGDVDFLVATDAVGMGLNLDVDHVAFSGTRKFDGQRHRELTPSEIGQIAGRAGRHLNDGTFGVTGNAKPFDADLVNHLEAHEFDPVGKLQWRNRHLEFASLDHLLNSLKESPRNARLTRGRTADDLVTLENAARNDNVRQKAKAAAALHLLWDVCQIPDYRKISMTDHTDLVLTLFNFLVSDEGQIPEDWFAEQVARSSRTDGDIDTLSTRISHIRTWTFVANRAEWLKDPTHWQERTREIEDNLSDAMHERLTQRFVDERTSVLMKRLRDDEELTAEIANDGSINVEDHYVGRLLGFQFTPDTATGSLDGKAARNAAARVLSKELSMRARRLSAAKSEDIKLSRQGTIIWREEQVARLTKGEDPLKPGVQILADEHLGGPDREKIQARLEKWIADEIDERLKPLCLLARAEDVTGLARGLAFRLTENFGIIKREAVADEVRALDQTARSQLRKYGLRFGAFNLYFPQLLKPAASDLLLALWWLSQSDSNDVKEMPEPPRSGLTSVKRDPATPEAFYHTSGFHICGERAVRIDMLERLADMIRPLVSWRADEEKADMPPAGATGDGGFIIQPEMMSIMGCSAEETGTVLKALGFRLERRPIKNTQSAPSAETGEATKNAPSAEPDDKQSDHKVEQKAPVAASSDETATPSEPAANEDVSPQDPATVAAAEDAVVYEEIWRPRRRKSTAERQEQRKKGHRRKQAVAGKKGERSKPQGKNEKRRPANAKAGESKRKNKRAATVDPDSPFAALSSLKKRLEEEVQDQA